MSDRGPRIFRNLEKSSARDSFDVIVRAAATSFAALRHPSDAQGHEFCRLVLPLLDKVTAETRRALAETLADCPHVPAPLAERLPGCVPDAAAPDHAPAAAAVQPPSPAADPRAALPPVEPPPTEPDAHDLLRRLGLSAARRGGRPEPEAAAPGEALLRLALARDRAGFFDALARRLTLSVARREETEKDAASLAAALKAANLPRADALTVLMMMAPRIGEDVGAFEAMDRLYASLDRRECLARFGGARPPAADAAVAPAHAETLAPHRPLARPVFGRRTGPAASGGARRRTEG